MAAVGRSRNRRAMWIPSARGRASRWARWSTARRSEEHTSELQSQPNLVCRLLLEKKKLGLARFHSFVYRFERVLDGNRSVGKDSFQDCFSACGQLSSGNDFVHEPDPQGLIRADHLARKNDL